MPNYWTKKGLEYWLSRAAVPLLFLIGFIIYKSVNIASDSYKLDQSEIARLKPQIESKKVDVTRSGKIKNIEWDSLTTEDLDIVFQVETIRKMFKELNKEDSINVESRSLPMVSGGRFRRLITAYQRNSLDERNARVRHYNDSIQTPFDKSIQQEFQRVWGKEIITPKDLNHQLTNDPSYGSSIIAEHSDILRPFIVTALMEINLIGFRESFVEYANLLKSNDTINLKSYRITWLRRVSKEVIEDVERKIVDGENILYLSFLD